MARIVNLRTRRKQKARDARRKESAGPAPGVSRAERERTEADNRLVRERLKGHRRNGDLDGHPNGDPADGG